MKRILVAVTLLSVLVAACSVPAAVDVQTATPVPPTSSSDPAELPAARAAREALAALLGLPLDAIRVLSAEPVEWPDSCLGVVRIDALCAQGIVPGFRVILEANGEQYGYHTNADGSSLVLAETSASQGAEQAAVEALAKALGIAVDAIRVLESRLMEWPDACLGAAVPGEMCAQVITPGYLIILEANGQRYEYRTNADGSAVRPASLALSWQREGGIAGFCDSLVVYHSGELFAASCIPVTGEFAGLLTAEERAQLEAWLAQYGLVNIEHADPAVADAMRVALYLEGHGAAAPDAAGEQAMIAWAQDVLARLAS